MARILVPFDDTPQAWEALEYVLGEDPAHDVTVLHVVSPFELYDPGGEVATATGPQVQQAHERTREQAEALVAKAREWAAADGVEVETAIVEGTPARAIAEYADANDVDQVVMGSHGRRGVARIILGSVAETVIRNATVPVTVVR